MTTHPATAPDLQTALAFQYDLYECWHAVRQLGVLKLGSGQMLTPAALKRMRAVAAFSAEFTTATPAEQPAEQTADEHHDARLLFACQLLRRLDLLLTAPEGVLVAADPARMRQYAELPLPERLNRCVRLWETGGSAPARARGTNPPSSRRALAASQVSQMRQHLVRLLAGLAPGAAVPVSPLTATATASAGDHARPPPARRASVRQISRQRRSSVVATDDDLANDLARQALDGPLRWLGLVRRVAADDFTPVPPTYHATAAVAALRTAPLPGDPPLEESCGAVIAQPNFDVVVYPPFAPAALLLLDTCAERRGRSQVAQYTLTRQAFALARRAGWPHGAVATHLAGLVGGELPQNVSVTLADWERAADRLRPLRDVVVLEVRDASILDALLADEHARAWIDRRLTPHIAVIPPERIAAVRAWLLRQGAMPALTPRSPAAHDTNGA
ncbi:MAG TPA: helicase-associated domain-containing protein [Ktedonobacterales bacterium]|nr:helicase-associated domain-containing protein [Ktedonobacterales bacterium]